MANLKRNMIRLVKNPEEAMRGAEIELETVWTSPFLPTTVTYEAVDLADVIEEKENKGDITTRETMDMLGGFVADRLYGGQFSLEDLKNRFHGPDFINEMKEQIFFIAQGHQSDETKKFLEKKN